MTMIAITHKGKQYTATFDEEGAVNAVVNDKGENLSSRHAIAATIIRHQEAIIRRMLPTAMTKAGWKWVS